MHSYTIRTQNLGKKYGNKRIFSAISFTFAHDVLGIAGPNGSGKSTLLQCLAGLQRPSSGSLEWMKDHRTISAKILTKSLGYAAPYVNLYPELTCRENLNFLLKLRNLEDQTATISHVLGRTGLATNSGQLFGKLSTGQQQRLRLAAALCHQPDILMLDEPGSNLDEEGHELIKRIVDKFRSGNRPVIIASNNPKELELCDRVYSVEREEFL